MCGVELHGGFAAEGVHPHTGQACYQVFTGADPERGIPVLAEPVGHANVVRVHVCDDNAQNRQAVEFIGENAFPVGFAVVGVDAGVNHAPAAHAVDAVAQQPKVDVVQLKWQRHAQPLHARCDFDAGAGFRQRVGVGVLKLRFECFHGGSLCYIIDVYVNVKRARL